MKTKVTEEEKENFCVQGFSKIHDIKDEKLDLIRELKNLEEEQIFLNKKYKELKEKWNEILQVELGRGPYYNIVTKPNEIKQRIYTLENNTFDHYTEKTNKREEKERNSLVPVLLEELEQAEMELKKFESFSYKIQQSFYDTTDKRIKCRRRIREVTKKILKLEKLEKLIFKQIKKINNAAEKGKKVNTKILKNNDILQ